MAASSSGLASPLNNVPPDIALHRERLFTLEEPVHFTPAVWDKYWPFIDNVWCVHQRNDRANPNGLTKIYGACRLHRKTNFPLPPVHENSRPRVRREGGTCHAKIRVTILPDGRKFIERMGEPHTHDLDHIDSIKRPSGVRNLVLDDFFKSWEQPGAILAFLRDDATRRDDGRDVLREAGGRYLTKQEINNIMNSALKRLYPGADVSEVKKTLDKYKNMTTCKYKGCVAPAFPDVKALMEHRKTVHGFASHDHSDKQYACPEKTCWRRKKSKGFATLLGLEEHMRSAHGKDPASLEESSVNIDPELQLDLPDLQNSITQDPMTPASSTPGADFSALSGALNFQSTPAQPQQPQPVELTEQQKRNLHYRISRLEIERTKLDNEIARLKRQLHGEQPGEASAPASGVPGGDQEGMQVVAGDPNGDPSEEQPGNPLEETHLDLGEQQMTG